MKQKHCYEQGFNQFIFQHCFLQVSKSIYTNLTKGYFCCFYFLFWNNYRYTGSCKNSTKSPMYPLPSFPQWWHLTGRCTICKPGSWHWYITIDSTTELILKAIFKIQLSHSSYIHLNFFIEHLKCARLILGTPQTHSWVVTPQTHPCPHGVWTSEGDPLTQVGIASQEPRSQQYVHRERWPKPLKKEPCPLLSWSWSFTACLKADFKSLKEHEQLLGLFLSSFLEPHRDLASLYQNLQLITHSHQRQSCVLGIKAVAQWRHTGTQLGVALPTDHLTLGQGRSLTVPGQKLILGLKEAKPGEAASCQKHCQLRAWKLGWPHWELRPLCPFYAQGLCAMPSA